MNQFDKQRIINNNKRKYIEPLQPLKYGVVKFYKNNTATHEITKEKLMNVLTLIGHDVLSEVKLRKPLRGRPDLLIMDVEPPIAVEIVCTESDDSIIRKINNYGDIKVVVVTV